MKCLSTRRTSEGFRRRRYVLPDGVRLTTLEVPIEVWNSVARPATVAARIASRSRELARLSLKQRGMAMLAEGWKPAAVANELNITARAVQRWRRNAT